MTHDKDEYQRVVEAEVNATIKLVMATMEDLAAMDPVQASSPHAFNTRRNAVIRKLWNMSKECIRYGAQSVHPQ
jgi:hypothetical protein